MKIRCPHCRAPNEIDAQRRSRRVVCTVCALSFDPTTTEDSDSLSGGADLSDPGGAYGLGGYETLDDPDGLPPLADFSTPDAEFGGLGTLPSPDEADDFDRLPIGRGSANQLAAILSPRSAARDALDGKTMDDSPDFRFGQDSAPVSRATSGMAHLRPAAGRRVPQDVPTRGAVMPLPREAFLDHPPTLDAEEEESTRVVDPVYVDQVMSQAPAALGSNPPQPTGWRVRNERGVVYELMTVDAVVAWLEGKPDIRGVKIARGDGPFEEVSAFPELAGRVGKRSFTEPPLSLDTTRASERHGGAITRDRPTVVRAPEPATVAAARKPSVENPVGLAHVLGLALAGFVLATGVVGASVALGWMSLPPAIEAASAASAATPSPRLAQAIQEFEAENYTAATNLLQRLAREEDAADPRVHRYLALALYRTDRNREARRALAEYRRRMRRASGDDEGQLREVQH
ncbi:MAG: hypothetical protein KC620_00530 [Myxococcales bacterium]|nr:hypothetical protein [Myxococcales bacterium]